jgi:hypothetical protein
MACLSRGLVLLVLLAFTATSKVAGDAEETIKIA